METLSFLFISMWFGLKGLGLGARRCHSNRQLASTEPWSLRGAGRSPAPGQGLAGRSGIHGVRTARGPEAVGTPLSAGLPLCRLLTATRAHGVKREPCSGGFVVSSEFTGLRWPVSLALLPPGRGGPETGRGRGDRHLPSSVENG